MILFIFAVLILSLIECKPIFGKGFHKNYASAEQTRSINGIFILLILFSHTYFAWVDSTGITDALYTPFRTFMGQFVVVPFLFYSGYGIMESLSKKEGYLKSFPKKRLLRIATQFTLITLLYVVLQLCLQGKYTLWEYLLSFTGITSIGNGGWYMLSTFVFYISIILCFNLFKRNQLLATMGVTACLVLLMVTEMLLQFDSYYYSTTIFFAVGMFYSLLKPYFDRIVMKNNIIWVCTMLLSITGFMTLKN